MPNAGSEFAVDTSVVVKYLLREPDSAVAVVLFHRLETDEVRMIAPDTLLVELVNALWANTLSGRLTVAEAREKVAAFTDLLHLLQLVPIGRLLVPILQLAHELRHPAYDCAFLALAEASGLPLLTADEKFYHKARAHTRRVVLLRDLKL